MEEEREATERKAKETLERAKKEKKEVRSGSGRESG
jgi:hypothetical protein